MGFKQGQEFVAGVGHQETLTRTTPRHSGLSRANSDSERSTTRSPCEPSRSVARQTTVLPVARSRTVTRVPSGRYHVAQRPGT